MTIQILIVDDDEKICQLMAKLLRREGYDVTYVLSALEAINLSKLIVIDLIVTDVMMPDMTGRAFVKEIREARTNFNVKIPIIMVSALYDTHDRVGGIKDGADDYLVKPFEPEELIIRISSLLRRYNPERIVVKKVINDEDGNELDIQRQLLTLNGKEIGVTEKEVQFLKLVMENPSVPISKHDVMRQLYPEHINMPESRVVEVMVGRLRKKLEERGFNKLQTRRGEGYYWLN